MRHAFLALCSALFCLGLSCSDGEDPVTPPTTSVALRCTPDPALIAAARECRSDDQCPCGAACTLGRCVATCAEDTPCADGEFCDAFGRCRAGDAELIVTARAPKLAGRPRVLQAGLSAPSRAKPALMTVLADDGPIAALRIVADPEVEVALAEPGTDPADLDYGAEVVADRVVPEGGALSVFVRPVVEPPPGEPGPSSSVTVVTDTNDATAVTVAAASTYRAPPVLAPPLQGVYEGTARLTLSGAQGGRGFEGQPPTRTVSTLVTAEIFEASGDRARLVLRDPLHVLHPSGVWVGEVVLGATPHVELPAFEQVPSTAVAASTMQLVTRARNGGLSADPMASDWSGSIGFDLDLFFDGAAGPRFTPRQVWTIGLGRVGDLPAGAEAPPLDTPATLDLDPQVLADTPLPHEAAVQDALTVDARWPPSETIPLAWRRDRAVASVADAHGCQDLVEGPANAGEPQVYLGGFAAVAVKGDFELEARGSAGVTWRSRENAARQRPAVSWDEFLAHTGGAIDLNAPALSELVQSLSLPSGALPLFPYAVVLAFGSDPAQYAYTLSDGTELEFAIPCAWDFSAHPAQAVPFISITQPTDLLIDPSGVRTDVCAQMRESYDCVTVPLAGRVAPADRTLPANLSLSVGYSTAVPRADQAYVGIDLPDTLVDEVCVFPRQPSVCVERMLCDDATRSDPLAVAPLGTTPEVNSGDLGCADTARGLWLDTDLSAASREGTLADCLADLADFDVAPAASTSGSPRARLTAAGWDAPAQCIQPLRFLAALTEAGRYARELGPLEVDRDFDRSDVVFLRLLQRYLQVRGFVASEAAAAGGLAAEFSTGGTPTAALDGLERALATSVEGWNLLLHPRIGESLAGVAPSALFDADYRRRYLPDAPAIEPDYTQADGLVVTMVSVLATQLELAEQIVERRNRAGDREVPASVDAILRVLGPVEAEIAMLVDRASSGGAEGAVPVWFVELQRARGRLDAARARLMLGLGVAVRGSDPLGIEQDDLPLYFSQVDTTAGQRFTAISDYILGSAAGGSRGIAQQWVDIAESRFAAARVGYLAEKARQVNQVNIDADLAERIKLSKIELGSAIQDACGQGIFPGRTPREVADLYADDPLELVFAPDNSITRHPGAVDFKTCWFRSQDITCREDVDVYDAVDDARELDGVIRDALEAAVEANAYNRLCVAGRAGAEVPLDRCDDDLTFTVGVFRRSFRGGCVWDAPLFTPIHFCDPLVRSATARPTGASEALLRLERRVLAAVGDTLPNPLSQTFVPRGLSGVRCAEVPTIEKTTPTLDYRAGPNPCTNGPQIGGFMPEVIYDPGPPDAPVDGVSRLRLECVIGDQTFSEIVTNADLKVTGGLDQATVGAAREQCDILYPRAFVANTQSETNFEVTKSQCYRGALGAQAATLRSLVAEVQIAESELAVMRDEYRIAMEDCFILQRGNQALLEAEDAFIEEQLALSLAKLAMTGAALAAEGAKECLGAVNGIEVAPDAVIDTAGAAAECAVGGVQKTAEFAAESLQTAMDNLQLAHDRTRNKIQGATDEKRCFNEAELAQVNAKTLELGILLALQNIQSAYSDFVNAVENAELTALRGVEDIEISKASGAANVDADPWRNADIASYDRAMRSARRAAYLAVRAVEYEFQMTTLEAGQVLLADDPDDLQAALESLRSIASTPSPNGNQPAELTEVFSLRDHLLQLAPSEAVPPGELGLSAEERFRIVLQDPRFAVYEDGTYRGQEIPFRIAPLAALERGESVGIPVVADNSCAERLWSLNASILGDPEKTFRGFAPQVNLEIRKRNTFFANWCDAGPEDFQVAATRPSKNLFREPGIAEGFDGVGGSKTDLFSKARIQALLDVPPGELLTDAYVDGASTELASRLLFGDYSLFIPASSIARVDDRGAATSDGLILSAVDDIAIRMDYLSVAR